MSIPEVSMQVDILLGSADNKLDDRSELEVRMNDSGEVEGDSAFNAQPR